MRSQTCRLFASLMLFTSMVTPASADSTDIIEHLSADTGSSFSYDRSSQEPVIEYRVHVHMIAEPQTEPAMQVFADGRVVIHRPAFMKDAGVYESQLSTTELNDLITEMNDRRLLQVDTAGFADRLATVRNNRVKNSGTFYHVSDNVTTSIDIRLKSFRSGRSAAAVQDVHRTVKLKNINQNARMLRGDAVIQDVAAGVARLRSVMKNSIRKGVRRELP